MIKDNNKNKLPTCPVCNTKTNFVFVHGHYQCPVCKQVVISCCEGDENGASKKKNIEDLDNTIKNKDLS